MRVLLVEDDDRLAAALTKALARHGHEVVRASLAVDALRLAGGVDFVLLDLGLPDMDGLEALRRLRRVSAVPLIVVTARTEEREVLRGLRSGADDYLVKPFRTVELMARMEAVVRRGTRPRPQRDDVVNVGDVRIDLEARQVTVAGEAVTLTRREFDLLAMLAREPGVVRGREEILDEIWGDPLLSASRSLDVHVANLRSKTGRPGLVETLRGTGYRLGSTA
ncbi:response regulator, two-component system [[Actinomadura] parvosata subsp. kistnae]|uniref:Sensory transduction protein RegX3 n=2 Tax=Nonomuraea TaxID=83681 RepID=A0A1V0A627_9ACTN|nr:MULTISPECIES: response regulator transcription factor [unclassified Nonomuraea]AQZ65651.1 DNA-binding response regulator [Nonomuraea sp. ATCC 55076]NJP89934.1 response regulator transcription factor [Nonomuraea sp. FMUSA5-5]SPL97042.1 response regulator, two-component system [Actinomadura parvosata subsp. kistnae]